MSRSNYFDSIEDKLSFLVAKVKMRNSLNLMDINIQCEQTFKHILNYIYNKNFTNSNYLEFNNEAFDLCDKNLKEIIQVTSSNTKQKVESTLKKQKLQSFSGYNLKFLIIDINTNLKKYIYKDIPKGIMFDPKRDILSMNDILNEVLNMDVETQNNLLNLINNEIVLDFSDIKLNSVLTTIINKLSEQNLNNVPVPNLNLYEINRKIDFNNLNTLKFTILTYKNYYTTVNIIYEALDKEGGNKSLVTLQHISDIYNSVCIEHDSETKIFLYVIDKVCDEVKRSANFNDISIEELLFCVKILVVDAFIKCKIFKNPEGYNYVIA